VTLRDRSEDLTRVLTALTLALRAFAETPDAWIAVMRKACPDVSPDTRAQLSRLYPVSWTVNGEVQGGELAFAEDWFNIGIKKGSVNLVHIGQWAECSPGLASRKARMRFRAEPARGGGTCHGVRRPRQLLSWRALCHWLCGTRA
jgi:hypothetical protein